MHFKSDSVQIRMRPMCRKEFTPALYRPGVISLSRLVWGSLGGGLLLAIIGLLSSMTGVEVLFPPLAATCFISSTCVFLRVARPKPVIVGHFVAGIGGLAGVMAGGLIAGDEQFAVTLKLGLAVSLAAVLMQLFDADHPPAAATAAIPAILPLPMPSYLLPINMAWGATIAVLFALVWNRIWFEFPARDDENCSRNGGLFMHKEQILGLLICTVGFVLISLGSVHITLASIGHWIMLCGVLILGTHHFWRLKLHREN